MWKQLVGDFLENTDKMFFRPSSRKETPLHKKVWDGTPQTMGTKKQAYYTTLCTAPSVTHDEHISLDNASRQHTPWSPAAVIHKYYSQPGIPPVVQLIGMKSFGKYKKGNGWKTVLLWEKLLLMRNIQNIVEIVDVWSSPSLTNHVRWQ